MRFALVLAILAVAARSLAADPPAPPGDRTGTAEKVWRGDPGQPHDRTPKRVAVPAPAAKAVATDELRQLGDVRALELREGEALLRVDGVELTIRPGMRLKTDLVKSISPKRMVLLRPEGVDAKKGETLIVVDVLGAGRSRVRMYTARDWTARPPRSEE
jgi:hypothetical protein